VTGIELTPNGSGLKSSWGRYRREKEEDYSLTTVVNRNWVSVELDWGGQFW